MNIAVGSESALSGKVITQLTFEIKNKKWIWNKTFEKWKKEMKDPFQPGKMAEDTMYILKHRNQITMRYKKTMIVNLKTGKLEERYPNV